MELPPTKSKRTIPGFTAELALDQTAVRFRRAKWKADDNVAFSVTPAGPYCDALLETCVSGDDPRSYECDSWLILC